MKKLISFFWQLPQNILGIIVIYVTKATRIKSYVYDQPYFVATEWRSFGVSLGNYIIFGKYMFPKLDVRLHEFGHQRQSRMLGPLYLLIIGIPSLLGNIFDRIFHKKWDSVRRCKWYYALPWEKWADELGGVERFKCSEKC